MKINGKLVFDASSASYIENLRIERFTTNPTATAADVGRLIYNTTDDKIYVGVETAGPVYSWSAIATGGDAGALQTEVDNTQASLGAGVNANGTFTYVPNAGFFGIDTFNYRANDPYYNPANPDQIGNIGTITIRVNRIDSPCLIAVAVKIDVSAIG